MKPDISERQIRMYSDESLREFAQGARRKRNGFFQVLAREELARRDLVASVGAEEACSLITSIGSARGAMAMIAE